MPSYGVPPHRADDIQQNLRVNLLSTKTIFLNRNHRDLRKGNLKYVLNASVNMRQECSLREYVVFRSKPITLDLALHGAVLLEINPPHACNLKNIARWPRSRTRCGTTARCTDTSRALDTARLPSNASVLDTGCGTGGLLRHLQTVQPTWRLSGLGFSLEAAQLARVRTTAEITVGSVQQLPFADECFDAITSCEVLCQVLDPAEALREFSRCLKPGGLVVLMMPAYQWLFSYHDRQVANLRRDSRREVRTLMLTAKLPPTSSTYWNTLPFPLAVLRRKIFPPADPTSDVRLYPAPLEAMFNAMMASEHIWIHAGGHLPFGSSVLVVARKPDHA